MSDGAESLSLDSGTNGWMSVRAGPGGSSDVYVDVVPDE
jgi:hypothetical protein